MEESRPRLEYRVAERQGDRVRVQLHGEMVGAGQMAHIRQALEQHFVDDGVRVITLDLSTVHFLDSFGAATLVGLMQESERQGKRLLVTGAERQVRDKLRVTGLLSVLEEGLEPESRGS
ncbi:MAG: STAS domain-containing protein [Actinomycetota bacterium]